MVETNKATAKTILKTLFFSLIITKKDDMTKMGMNSTEYCDETPQKVGSMESIFCAISGTSMSKKLGFNKVNTIPVSKAQR